MPGSRDPEARGEPSDGGVRLGRFEVLGAWLRIWTPPRGATVPRVPTRKLAIAAVIGGVLLAGTLALLIPRIEGSKRTAAERERAASAQLRARELDRLRRDQRLHAGMLPDRVPRERRELVSSLERAIASDARDRVRSGSLRGPILRTECRPYSASPGSAPSRDAGRVGRYECLAVTADIAPTGRNVAGAIGYSFWSRVDFNRWRYVWCKITPRPAEGSITREAARAALPAPCDLTRVG